jgi:hypothetical protein
MNINLGVDLNQFEFWIKPRTCWKRDTDSQFYKASMSNASLSVGNSLHGAASDLITGRELHISVFWLSFYVVIKSGLCLIPTNTCINANQVKGISE